MGFADADHRRSSLVGWCAEAMKLLGPRDYRTVPWKNGGGTTLELFVDDGGTPERFRARASIADVRESGPFSKFAGYERHIVIVEGEGMTLDEPSGATPLRPWEPYTFDGDRAVTGLVARGPVRDFNWIVDRRRLKRSGLAVRRPTAGTVERVAAAPEGVALVHVFAGSVRGLSQDGTMVLTGESAELVVERDALLVVGWAE